MQKSINGLVFEISAPYAEGQTIGPAEAKALNQVRAENIGNNLREKIKAAQTEGKSADEIASLVASADASYVLTVSQVSAARKLDPIEKEAYAIAREMLKAHLAKDGRKLTVAPAGETEESWKEKIQDQLDKIATNESVVAEAKKTVKAKEKRAAALAEAISLG